MTEDSYDAHRRRLRQQTDDDGSAEIVDLPGGGFITADGRFCCFVIGDDKPKAGSDTWGLTPEEIAQRRWGGSS